MIDLRHRYVELGAQAILQALDVMAFVFERMCLIQAQLKSDDADGGHRGLRHGFGSHALSHESFDDIAGLDVVVILERNTAFEA